MVGKANNSMMSASANEDTSALRMTTALMKRAPKKKNRAMVKRAAKKKASRARMNEASMKRQMDHWEKDEEEEPSQTPHFLIQKIVHELEDAEKEGDRDKVLCLMIQKTAYERQEAEERGDTVEVEAASCRLQILVQKFAALQVDRHQYFAYMKNKARPKNNDSV
jgi:hypothetical protein